MNAQRLATRGAIFVFLLAMGTLSCSGNAGSEALGDLDRGASPGGRAATALVGGGGTSAPAGAAAGIGGVSASGGASGLGGAATAGVGGTGATAGGGGTGATTGGGGTAGKASGGTGGAGGTATTGDAGAPPPDTLPTGCAAPTWDPADFATVYDVGDGETYASVSDVPWEALDPGTLVRIHRRAAPYLEKFVVNGSGTVDAPIVVLGVPDAQGQLPELRGAGATTRTALDYWGESRAIVKVGASSIPSNDDASYIFIECLDIAGARPGNTFTDDAGAQVEYSANAAAITVEQGTHVTLRNNTLHDSGNGLFSTSTVTDLVVSGNHIYDNGIPDSIYQHNSYTESAGILFEYNHYGPLCAGCLGNNLKDRSAGTVIRYNWIESGNRQLDLVESDHAELVALPAYRSTFVYGNVLIEPDGAGNSQIVHYGGDGGDATLYRKGTLYFFHNTVVSTRSGNTTLFRLSTDEETVEVRNDLVFASAGGSSLAIVDGSGTANLADTWLPTGYVATHGTLTGSVNESGVVTGASPGFTDLAGQDLTLVAGAEAVDQGAALPAAYSQHPVTLQYEKHQTAVPRPSDGPPDLGAFER